MAAGSQCFHASEAVDCPKIAKIGITSSECSDVLGGCHTNRTKTACTARKYTCDLYSIDSCLPENQCV